MTILLQLGVYSFSQFRLIRFLFFRGCPSVAIDRNMILLKHNGLALVFSTTKMLVRHKIPEVLSYRKSRNIIFTLGYCYSLADKSHRDMNVHG